MHAEAPRHVRVTVKLQAQRRLDPAGAAGLDFPPSPSRSPEEPIVLRWSAESSFESALIQQYMSVLRHLHCMAAHRAVAKQWQRGVVAESGVVPGYDESQAVTGLSMPYFKPVQRCSRLVGFAVWGMGDGQCERGDLVQTEMPPAQTSVGRHWDTIS